jgi:hypothetical protein
MRHIQNNTTITLIFTGLNKTAQKAQMLQEGSTRKDKG